jgi:murein DD-endopeptidase MepM/ murein hydrolase activator NlpD
MKKLYYFSSSQLQFVEVKNIKKKVILYFFAAIVVLTATLYGTFNFIAGITGSGKSISTLKKENTFLQNKLEATANLYKKLNFELDSLTGVNNTLRLAANLPPISSEEKLVGVGGGYFDNEIDFMGGELSDDLKEALTYVDEVSRKVEFEKSQYQEISIRLKQNEKLYECLPAIKPCSGEIGNDFGMRMHPILKVKRMHEGIDIITDMGTSIHASGDGVIEFVGDKGGYGLCVEINHGFGYKTVYGHLSEVEVKVGQKVKRGFVIAKSGTSGLSTGPHLHYEVEHNGVKLNPADFFFDDINFFAVAGKN